MITLNLLNPSLFRNLSLIGPIALPAPHSHLGTAAPESASSFRQIHDVDYRALSRIHNDRFPELPLSPGEMRFADANRDSRCVLERWIYRHRGGITGFTELTQSSENYHPTRFQFRLYVRPEFESLGPAGVLFEKIIEAFHRHGGTSLRILAREDHLSLTALLERSGFAPSMKFLDRTLELKNLKWLAKPPGKVLSDIRIATLREIRWNPECRRKLFDLEKAIQQDVPHPDGPSMRFDYFERAVLGHPGLLPEGYLVAMDGERYVGLCRLFRRDGNQTAYVGLTGVLPGYRKRGIAKYLKVKALHYARGAGFETAFTTNEEGNRAIGDLNERMGFRIASSRTLWTKEG